MDQVPGSEPPQKNQVSFLSPELCGPATHQSQLQEAHQEGVWLPVHSVLDSYSTITARKQHALGFGATRTPRWYSKAGQPHRRVPFGA